MCQFKVVTQQQQVGGGGCQCRCSLQQQQQLQQLEEGEFSIEGELRKQPDEFLARYFSEKRPLDECHRTASDTTSDYSPALAAELVRKDKPVTAGSSKRRQRVRFADDLGRSLIEIRLYKPDPPICFEHEELHIENAWKSAPARLDENDERDAPRLVRHFQLPGLETVLPMLVSEGDGVRLFELRLDIRSCSIVGRAVTINMGYQKRVFVRVTLNAWRSFADIEAAFAGAVENDKGDSFAFQLPLSAAGGLDPITEQVEFEFCLGCQGDNETAPCLWDNNDGGNYRAALQPPPRRATFCIDSDEDD